MNSSRRPIALPCFTELPTRDDARAGLFVSALLAVLMSILYPLVYSPNSYIFFGIFIIHLTICVVLYRGNLIILFRHLLLGIPILATSVAWQVWEGEVYTAPFGIQFQKLDSTMDVVIAGMLSILGSSAGWFFAFISNSSKPQTAFNMGRYKVSIRFISVLGLLMALFWGGLYLYNAGGALGGGRAYTEGSGVLDVKFAVYNVLQLTGVALIFIAMRFETGTRRLLLASLAGLSLAFGMLAGSRADYIFPFLLVMVYYNSLPPSAATPSRIELLSIRKRYGFLLTVFSMGFILSTTIAQWRSARSMPVSEVLGSVFSQGSSLVFNNIYGHPMIYMETANMMIGGLYAMVVRISTGEVDFLWGSSYLDYLARLPPAFLGWPRPDESDLAWSTSIQGLQMSQGGIFEVAEAYANFGFAGCFAVSFAVSFFMAGLLKVGLRRGDIFFVVWYLVNGLMLPRAIWYQNFAFVRIASIFALFWIALTIFRGLRGRSHIRTSRRQFMEAKNSPV